MGITAHQHRPFNHCLSHQQTIKGVFVIGRQVIQSQNMLQRNGGYLDVIGLLLAGDDFSQRQSQLEFSQLEFDLHLPHTNHAEQQDILTILAEG
jgi:hypothetical protein